MSNSKILNYREKDAANVKQARPLWWEMLTILGMAVGIVLLVSVILAAMLLVISRGG